VREAGRGGKAVARKPEGVSPFQRRVYEAVCRIPRGRVSTYARVAAEVGCGAPRAIGQALKRNPYAPRVPCHRVIGADLGLGGFDGCRAGLAVSRKRALLKAEGVEFRGGRLADERLVFRYGAG
jgi:methylated-DNA-[protein]-cysteine S-methyltransferase